MNREYGLDFARLVAAYLVLFGHFVLSGTFETASRTWIGESEALPLLDKTSHFLWMPDIYLLEHARTASAILGVALFFLISGWVVPPMLARYSKLQFLTNRFFRIFPMLFFAVFLAAIIQYFFGDRASLTIFSVISTATLSNQITDQPMSLGVIWTLIIEFKFYILLVLVGRLNYIKILIIVFSFFLLLAVQIGLVRNGLYYDTSFFLKLSNSIIHDSCFLLFMLCGSVMWLILQKKENTAIGLCILIVLFALINIYRFISAKYLNIVFYQDIGPVTQISTFSLLYFCFFLKNLLRVKVARSIGFISNITYSLYLIHVSIGLFLISRLRHDIDNPYLLLITVTILVTIISAITYLLIEKPGIDLGKRLVGQI